MLGRHWLLVSGLILVGFYFASIAAVPIVYFFIGWAIPSLVNISLSAWIVSFVSSWLFRCLLFIPISFLLGLNIFLPTLVGSAAAQPEIEQIIYRKVRLDPSLPSVRLEFQKKGSGVAYFVANPLTSAIQIGR
jgi:hypothetical protein